MNRQGWIVMNRKGIFPVVPKAAHIAEILGVSEPTAYKLMRKEGFPLISYRRSMRTLRDEFFKWLED